MFACVGPVLQINRRTEAGVSGLLRFQRGLPDTEWRHAGKFGLQSKKPTPFFIRNYPKIPPRQDFCLVLCLETRREGEKKTSGSLNFCHGSFV